MEVRYPRSAGLDVHAKSITGCARMANGATVTYEHRTFSTSTRGLLELSEWLAAVGCTHVAMEATGVYWKPAWHVLEDQFTLILANAMHIRNIPGRKSDMNDATWIADLLAHGLIRNSFVPPAPIQALRDLTRTRKQLSRELARHTVCRREPPSYVKKERIVATIVTEPPSRQRDSIMLRSPVNRLLVFSAAILTVGCHMNGMMPMAPTGMMGAAGVFSTNGETIFRTGRNLEGTIMQDLSKSEMPMAHSCVSCHGPNGAGMPMSMMGRTAPSIRFRDLIDPAQHEVPYTEELLKRFLDHETKSDGTVARTGVAWKMSEQDKDDLIAFLKTL